MCVFNDYEVRSEIFSYVLLFLQNVIIIASWIETFLEDLCDVSFIEL